MPKKLLMLQALSARDRDLTEDELTDIIAFYNENPVRSEPRRLLFQGDGGPRQWLKLSPCPSRLSLANICTSLSSRLSTPRCYLHNCPRPSSELTNGCASALGWTLTDGRGSLSGCTLATGIFLAGTPHRAAVMASPWAYSTHLYLQRRRPGRCHRSHRCWRGHRRYCSRSRCGSRRTPAGWRCKCNRGILQAQPAAGQWACIAICCPARARPSAPVPAEPPSRLLLWHSPSSRDHRGVDEYAPGLPRR